jgi:uncharacterized phage protein gp47/JayE
MANEINIKTFDTLLTEFLAYLDTYGSQITNASQPGGAYNLLIRISCLMISDAYAAIQAAANLIPLDNATGAWLDLKAQEVGLTREAASKTRKEFTLSRTSTSGALNVAIGDIIKTPIIPKAGALRFFSIENPLTAGFAGTFADGIASITIQADADEPGSDYNNVEIQLGHAGDVVAMEIESGFSGVDEIESTGEDLVPGVDDETDLDLRERIKTRWNELAAGSNRQAYINFAKESSTAVFDANIGDEKNIPTEVQVILSGPPGSRELNIGTNESADNFDPDYTEDLGNTIHAYIRARMPLTDYLVLASVTEQDEAIALTVKAKDGYDIDSVIADVIERINALGIKQKEYPSILPMEVGEDLLFSRLCLIVGETEGVSDFDFSYPAPGDNIICAADVVLKPATNTTDCTEME